jgi:uncharacterized DUF497 family protein
MPRARLVAWLPKSHSLAYLYTYVHIAGLQFSWEEAKRQVNLCQHGLDFADASAVFEGTTFTVEDDRFDYGEQRFIMLGLLHGRVVIIAHTECNDEVRVISMWEGTTREHILYFRRITTSCRTP